jgi:DNA polymerase III sliding clamp (beta) subunit (PCNA family)
VSDTVVSFEAGTIGDAIKKAASVAPTKVGSAFDRAAGIIISLTPGTDAPCIVRSTDTDLFYTESVDVVRAEGDPAVWRLPSMLLAQVLSNLASKGPVTFTQVSPTEVLITCGRMKARMVTMDPTTYPRWGIANMEDLREAPDFGSSILRVEWAASKSGPSPLNGIRLDGDFIMATDRYRIARTPCKIDLPNGPITIPAGTIGRLLKPIGDVLIGIDGPLFVAMPDDWTQIKTTTIDEKFPDMNKIFGIDYEQQVKVPKATLLEYVNKAAGFAGADRAPIVTIIVGQEELAVMLRNREVGTFGDVIEVPGEAQHPRIQINITPGMLTSGLSNAPGHTVTFKYNPSNIKLPLGIDGEGGYQVWLAPRTEKDPT